MEDKQKYIQDLKEIRNLMNRSSKFISLSGLSGISAGVIGIIGAFIAYWKLGMHGLGKDYQEIVLSGKEVRFLILLAVGTFLGALAGALFFTARKARKNRQKLNDPRTRKLLTSLAIPLLAGGIICSILLIRGEIQYILPLSLIFYGLGLISAGDFTLTEIRSLGFVEISLGLLGFYIGYGLLFWAIGFGLMHIVYGIFMHRKYGS